MIVSNLLFYKIMFSLEILTAEFLFTVRLKKRSYFALRFAAGAIAVIAVAVLFPVAFRTEWYTSLMFLAIFLCTLPMLILCYDEPFVNLLFCGIAAYTSQHFAYELANLALTLTAWSSSPLLDVYAPGKAELFEFSKPALLYWLIFALCYFTAYVTIYYLFAKRINSKTDMRIKSVPLMLLIGAGLVVNILLHSVTIYKDYDKTSVIVDCVYNLMCCILLLFGQFGLLDSAGLKSELSSVKLLLSEAQGQYAALKENMSVVNMKCHDIRYQIRAIGSNNSISNEVIDEIENSVRVYDTVIKTGNEALDIILTEKSAQAQKRGIALSCIADGAALEFVRDIDMYALFCNALDNAIEAVSKISDGERRLISINVARSGNMVSVCVKNTFDGTLSIGQNGMPETSKDNADYHGFGIKSMKYIVEKYDGNLSFETGGGLFRLNVLLPVPRELAPGV